MPTTVVFQVVADQNWVQKFADPNFWQTYKLYVVREITEGAAEKIRGYAARLWKKNRGLGSGGLESGGLDQSWFTRYDINKSMGMIINDKPYAYWLNYGIRPHKMMYLLNSSRAWYMTDGSKAVTIPLIIDGEKTFRVASEREMKKDPAGKPWFHPGTEPKDFLRKGMEEYKDTQLRNDFKGLMIRVLNLTV